MAATHHDDISLTIGDEWLIIGKMLDENGEPLDLTADIELGWTLLAPDGNQVPGIIDGVTIEPQQERGIVHIIVSDTVTRWLEPARYMDAIRAWTGGEPATQWTGLILAEVDPFHRELEIVIEPPLLPAPPFEDAPDDGKLYVRRSGQWVELPSGFSDIFEYTFDNATDAPPNNSQLRFDNADLTLVTKVWLHNNNADGVDISNLLTLVEQGFVIFIQDKDDPTQRVRFHATGNMTNMGTYCEIPVMYITSLGTLNDNQRLIVVVYGGG